MIREEELLQRVEKLENENKEIKEKLIMLIKHLNCISCEYVNICCNNDRCPLEDNLQIMDEK